MLCIGDDRSDEDMFEVVNALQNAQSVLGQTGQDTLNSDERDQMANTVDGAPVGFNYNRELSPLATGRGGAAAAAGAPNTVGGLMTPSGGGGGGATSMVAGGMGGGLAGPGMGGSTARGFGAGMGGGASLAAMGSTAGGRFG